MADEVKIPVSLPGAAQASADAKRVADGLDKINKATKEQAAASKETAKGLNELGEASEKGAAVGRVLGEVMRGNIFAIAQLGSVLKATGAAVKTSVFGILLIGATALFNFLPGLITKLRGTKEEIDSTAKGADHLATAFENIAKARSNALSKELEGIAQQAKGAADELQRIVSLREAINKANGGSVADSRKNDDMKAGAEYTAALDDQKRTAEVLAKITDELSSLQQSIGGVMTARERRRGLELELAGLQRKPGGTSAEAMARGERMKAISDELAATTGLNSPETTKFLLEQNKRAVALRADAERAAKEAAAADEKFRLVGRDVVGVDAQGRAIRPNIAVARGLEDRATRQAANLPEPASSIGTPGMASPLSSSAFSFGAGVGKDYEAIARAMIGASEQTGAAMAQAMIEAVRKANEAQIQAFREQLKALQR